LTPKKKTLAASRTRQVSTKVNGETHEKLRHSAKKSLPVLGRPKREATMISAGAKRDLSLT